MLRISSRHSTPVDRLYTIIVFWRCVRAYELLRSADDINRVNPQIFMVFPEQPPKTAPVPIIAAPKPRARAQPTSNEEPGNA